MNLIDYLGIRYVEKGRDRLGVDCWGLVYLFYKEHMGIELPTYVEDYNDTVDRKSVSKAILDNIGSWAKVTEPKFGDMIVFNILGLPLHTGIYVGDGDFLHSFRKTNSCIERLSAITWNRRIEGIYRWVKI